MKNLFTLGFGAMAAMSLLFTSCASEDEGGVLEIPVNKPTLYEGVTSLSTVVLIGDTVTVTGGATLQLPLDANVGDSTLSEIAIYENGVLKSAAELSFSEGTDTPAFSANPLSLSGDALGGFDWTVSFAAAASTSINDYKVLITDIAGYADSLEFSVKVDETPLSAATAFTWIKCGGDDATGSSLATVGLEFNSTSGVDVGGEPFSAVIAKAGTKLVEVTSSDVSTLLTQEDLETYVTNGTGVTSISIGYNIGDPTPQVHNPNKYVATESAGSYYLVYLSETSGVKADCDASIAGNENKITVTGTYKN